MSMLHELVFDRGNISLECFKLEWQNVSHKSWKIYYASRSSIILPSSI